MLWLLLVFFVQKEIWDNEQKKLRYYLKELLIVMIVHLFLQIFYLRLIFVKNPQKQPLHKGLICYLWLSFYFWIKKSKCVKRDNRYSFMWKTNHKLLSSIVRAQHNRQFPSPSIVSWGLEVTPSATPFSKGLTKLAILPDFKHPVMLCLALTARRKVWKLDF